MLKKSNLNENIKALLGPTNTGKTFFAIEQMLNYSSGMIGFPLRLLAREVYEKVSQKCGKQNVALITGEERIMPENPRYWICTVESMPMSLTLDFVAIDEIQLCADLDRGHIFTNRLLNLRGKKETIFLGSSSIKKILSKIVPNVQFLSRKRLSKLTYLDSRKINKIQPRSAIVCFSVEEVYSIAEIIRREKGGAAIVTGGLSPKTRNSQVALYQSGEVDYLVATDAIGMGLNLDLANVSFASLTKFDGFNHRKLFVNELAQIAGRAGRYTSNGTFGTMGSCEPLTSDVIHNIENHRFLDIKKIQWRNSNLSFENLNSLIESLNIKPEKIELMKSRESTDLSTFKMMSENHLISEKILNIKDVKLLWKVCQIPDYRKISLTDHVQMLTEIFLLLIDNGELPERWLEKKIISLDKYDGEIEKLSRRLSYIRTWNYVANRGSWLENPSFLQKAAKSIEEKLSDKLHQLLIERFIDRRTTVLLKIIRGKGKLNVEFNQNNDLLVENQIIGRVEGLNFVFNDTDSSIEKKRLLLISKDIVVSKIKNIVDQLYETSDSEFSINNSGEIIWQKNVIGRLVRGNSIYKPIVKPIISEIIPSSIVKKIETRIQYFTNNYIKENFSSLFSIMDDKEIAGISAGLIFIMSEHLGVLSRNHVIKEVKSLDQDCRAKFRKYGFRFGQYSVYHPLFLKPEPTRLRMTLWNIFNQVEKKITPPLPGLVTVPILNGVENTYYEIAGFKNLGSRAIRIDMLERLADLIRSEDTKRGFKVTSEMLSITGLSFTQIKDILENLNYKSKYIPHPVINPLEADNEKKLGIIINENNKDSNLGISEPNLGLDTINQNQIIFQFDYKNIKRNNTFVKHTRNKNNIKHLETKPKNNFITKKNKDRKKLDPNNPFAALRSLIKD
ncbi:MAG: helicase-related protein [Paracoccaceae bacterium]